MELKEMYILGGWTLGLFVVICVITTKYRFVSIRQSSVHIEQDDLSV